MWYSDGNVFSGCIEEGSMRELLLSLLVMMSLLVSGCGVRKSMGEVEYDNEGEVVEYIVVCNHPAGHILDYRVSKEVFEELRERRGGLWSFDSLRGTKVLATFCHIQIGLG